MLLHQPPPNALLSLKSSQGEPLFSFVPTSLCHVFGFIAFHVNIYMKGQTPKHLSMIRSGKPFFFSESWFWLWLSTATMRSRAVFREPAKDHGYRCQHVNRVGATSLAFARSSICWWHCQQGVPRSLRSPWQIHGIYKWLFIPRLSFSYASRHAPFCNIQNKLARKNC